MKMMKNSRENKMEKFEEEKKRFLEEFAYKDELIKQLKTLDASSVRYGDMCAFGC